MRQTAWVGEPADDDINEYYAIALPMLFREEVAGDGYGTGSREHVVRRAYEEWNEQDV